MPTHTGQEPALTHKPLLGDNFPIDAPMGSGAVLVELVEGPHGGRMFTSAQGTFEVYGAIFDKYHSIGLQKSVLGYPISEETGTPDGVGRFNTFEHGSIYWTPTTGAHVVYGAIRDRWSALGWEKSYLGFPLSDELDFDEGGRVNQFQGGQIYWWPDTGAIDLNEVVVQYTGMMCFGESAGLGSDEPYAVFGVVAPAASRATTTKIYENVDSGESVVDLVEIYRGKPGGIVISTTIIEHDLGDPNVYLDKVKGVVDTASAAVAGVLTIVPVVGAILAATIGLALSEVANTVSEAINSVFGTGDDTIGHSTTKLSAKQMVVLSARTAIQPPFKGIVYKVETDLITDGDASYKAYFELVTG